MTENEAIKILTLSEEEQKEFPNLKEIYEVAVKALEEVQQYRDLGTIDELAEIQVQYYHLLHKTRKYEAIGTVEECRTAVEKMKPKKPVDRIMFKECPVCGNVEIEYCRHCSNCGQLIDWSNT